ncbi:hypothetical protein BDY24DRAFT_382468, partial [Mrakia frigida]|uniref:uncharacterized protein n=1 Tax=Mrakia frigida TaxID=29902 RepID=UPI003FCC024D
MKSTGLCHSTNLLLSQGRKKGGRGEASLPRRRDVFRFHFIVRDRNRGRRQGEEG